VASWSVGLDESVAAADRFEDRTDREACFVRLMERWLPPR
jgi:hypothetical protein